MNALIIIALSILITLMLTISIGFAHVIYKFRKSCFNRLDSELVSLHA